MGIASIVLGVIAAIASFIPCCNLLALIPAVIGLILGIVDVVKKSKAGESKTQGIIGIVLACIAVIIAIVVNIMFGGLLASSEVENAISNALGNSIYNNYYEF